MMKLLYLGLSSSLLVNSCQTIKPANESEGNNLLRDTAIYCSMKMSDSDSEVLAVEIKPATSTANSADITIRKGSEEATRHLELEIPSDGLLILPMSNTDELAISLIGKPVIAKINASKDLSKPSNCIQLQASSQSRAANCQAIGTPAEGWYQAGRIIQHTTQCQSKILTCGSQPTNGWYVQKKLKQNKRLKTPCSGQQATPACIVNDVASGWYLGGSILFADASCSTKKIECSDSGSPNEGWTTFETSQPELIAAESCQPNRNISYLAR
jgi:hypothetical protein